MTNDNITLDDLRLLAQRVGLRLDDDELQRLLAGVSRAKKQAGELRAFVSLETEPAAIFQAGKAPSK